MDRFTPSIDKRTLLTVVMALLVGLHGFAGAAMADDHTATVSLAEAADSSSDSVTRTLTYTFTASSNQTVTANDRVSRDGGNVVFEFQRWDDRSTGQGGTGTSWTLTAGHTYEVEFEATVTSNAAAQRHTAQVFSNGPYAQLEVDVTEPQFGYIGTQDVDLAFTSQDQGTATKEVEIRNNGQGLMMPSEVEFSGVPSGFSVDDSNLPSEISAGGSESVELEVTVDSSVSEGTYEFDATVTDNLGNAQSFPVSVTVSKPPVLGVESDDETVDVGDVLVGTQTTTSFTVTEEAGYNGIDGVNSRTVHAGQYGSISFDGLTYVDTSAGGSDTAEVTVSASENAPQHADLRWTVNLAPNDQNGVGKNVEFVGRAIYPARYGDLSTSNTSMVFDEPRSQVTRHTKTVTVSVPNEGDLDMNVQNVMVDVGGSGVSASVVDAPDTIGGTSTGEVEVEVSADPETREGSYPLEVTVDAEDAGRETISKDVEITHGIELDVAQNELNYGDVIVTKNLTKSIDVSESLEYEDVSGLSITKESGPDQWLTVVERPPSRLTAGESAPFVVALQFDTGAELYREYTWEFEVSGDGVETQTITVTATSKPYSFDQIRDPLDEHTGSGDWRSETASGMVGTLNTLESELRGDGDVSQTDLSTSIAAGRSTLLFIESVENARETRDSDGNEAAQEEVVRAAAAYNLMDSYVSKLDDSELRSSAGESRSAAKQTVDQLVGEQREYYQSQLDSGDLSMIERAHVKRQLAQLASLRGDEQRAERLRSESAVAFEDYSETVAEGTEQRQQARTAREEMRDSMLTVVVGQPLLLNPAEWDAFDRQSAAVLSSYDEAATSLETAGATEEAQSVRQERQQAASQLQITRYSLYGSTAIYSLGFLAILGYIGRNTLAYVRDARAAVSGDFLVAS